jgi:two-component system sensor histidine kinase TctE
MTAVEAKPLRGGGSIRRRLVLQLLVVAAMLSGLLYLSVRGVATAAVETTQDGVLGAATLAIAEELRGGEDGVAIDIPYTAFSMLGSIGEDRVFYRILVGGETVTGYEDLPRAPGDLRGLTPVFYTRPYQGDELRIAAVERTVLVDGQNTAVEVIVGQTRTAQEAIVAQMANRAAALGLGFFLIAATLSILTAQLVLRPFNTLAEAVGRRGPQDLRPVTRPVPDELSPFVRSLNGFIARLGAALSRTETFIAEAAHHIRTPLATVRAQTEIALRETEDEPARDRLRAIIRAVDDSARSAGQLLDHAAVVYRTDQRTDEAIDLSDLIRDLARTYAPAAEMKDIDLRLTLPDTPVTLVADRVLVESALRNLLDNAVKYSDPDGEIEVALGTSGDRATVRVLDRGRGLQGATTDELTTRFRRGPNAQGVVGSGLGLTIVGEVAAAQGGDFRIYDREGGGTCADLSLPLR